MITEREYSSGKNDGKYRYECAAKAAAAHCAVLPLLTGALKAFDDFSGNGEKCGFAYDFNAFGFSELLSKYPVSEAAGNGDELSKALNLFDWCAENVLHNGGEKDVEFIPKTSLDILNYSYKKGREYGVYCRLQAIVFTECCLALGIKSRILHCLPFSPYDFESHVVSIVYIKSLGKWIMLDAGNKRYFTDEYGMILSPMESRKRLAANDYVKCNINDDSYKKYMAKNLFYFKSPKINTFGSDIQKGQETIYCAPKGFNVSEREIACCEYAIKNSPLGLADDWKNALDEYTKRTRIINAGADAFFE